MLVVTDDLIKYGKSDDEIDELLKFTIDSGFTFRDDSPLVAGYVENNLDTWTVSHPHFFEAAYKTRPTIFELEHYLKVKNNGHWLGINGEDVIPEIGVSGAEIFRNAIKLIHPTYIGFHGYLGEWLADNPDLTKELLNLSGYWFFPKSIKTTQFKKSELIFEIEWQNKGVAPAYSIYQLRGKLIGQQGSETIEFIIENSGNKNWMPGESYTEKYEVEIPGKPEGEYDLAIQLFDNKSQRPVELGLKNSLKQNEFFLIQKITF
jgi:hypothetical protein